MCRIVGRRRRGQRLASSLRDRPSSRRSRGAARRTDTPARLNSHFNPALIRRNRQGKWRLVTLLRGLSSRRESVRGKNATKSSPGRVWRQTYLLPYFWAAAELGQDSPVPAAGSAPGPPTWWARVRGCHRRGGQPVQLGTAGALPAQLFGVLAVMGDGTPVEDCATVTEDVAAGERDPGRERERAARTDLGDPEQPQAQRCGAGDRGGADHLDRGGDHRPQRRHLPPHELRPRGRGYRRWEWSWPGSPPRPERSRCTPPVW
ncbi:hypothetical protein LV75_003294 [Actinokineospora diospyrosa]|uniref:Uncharacterized protein n=1 Tax=Actinokineospora diospyrosa TaxID=103728 RepID=A0ABT1IDR1_9PSEU|nr:hypothetical protein [Actinokineospora diospyrosa]